MAKAKKAASKKTVAPKSIQPVLPSAVPSVWKISGQTLRLIGQHKLLLSGIIGWYLLLNLLFVQSLANGQNIGALQNSLSHGYFDAIMGDFSKLIANSGASSTPAGGAYGLFLTTILSLAVIWTVRQLLAGRVPRVRDAYYRGMFPLVPFVLVLALIGLQLLPLVIGATLYNIAVTNGIVVNLFQQTVAGLLALALALLSFYWLASSTMALYIVTLADMTPRRALKSAKDLVRGKRWTIVLRILFLPLALLLAAAIVLIPTVLVAPVLANILLFVLGGVALVIVHAYLFSLYRGLLPNEQD